MMDPGRPADYNLPPKFVEFRKTQKLGLSRVLEEAAGLVETTRFRGCQMIVGSGKTGYYFTLDRIRKLTNHDHRTVIVVMTRPHQDQILDDFADIPGGIADLRGRSNYACRYHGDCDTGGVERCPLDRTPGCPHAAAVAAASDAPVVLTNLACWIAINRFGGGLGKFDLMIIDEAHALFPQLTEAGTVRVLSNVGPRGEFSRLRHDRWKDYAAKRSKELEAEIPRARGSRAKRLKREKMEMDLLVSDLSPATYAIDVNRYGVAQLTPIWPADYAERVLYRGIPEVCLLSGTLLPRMLDAVGALDHRFEDYEPEIDPAEWPVQLVDCGRIQHDMSDSTRADWINAHATVLSIHPDLKGLVHTVSYDRAKLIRNFLPDTLQRRVRLHTSSGLRAAIAAHKAATTPDVLCSPAVATGFDFPDEDVNFTIVSKMPRQDFSALPNLRRARRERDKLYENGEMMNAFLQSIGRRKRRSGQRAAVYVLDSHARYLLPEHRGSLVPEWLFKLLDWGRRGDETPRPAFNR